MLNAVFWICLLIFYFSLLKYTYLYNYRSHISLQVAKLAKSAGVQILIFPTVHTQTNKYNIVILHFFFSLSLSLPCSTFWRTQMSCGWSTASVTSSGRLRRSMSHGGSCSCASTTNGRSACACSRWTSGRPTPTSLKVNTQAPVAMGMDCQLGSR